MDNSKKRKAISLETKYQILKCVEEGKKAKKDIATDFGVLPNTLSTILKKKEEIIKNYETASLSPSRKRQRHSSSPDVDKAMFEWFKEQRNQNMPISGPLLLRQSEKMAEKLGNADFKPTVGWLDRFKCRYGIVCRTVSGESSQVNPEIEEDWRESKLPVLLRTYKPCDIFNADETGLFYKAMPNKTLQLKGEQCHGGKKCKDRLTVLLASNMDGSEKLKLLVIGKFQNPRCFKGVKSLPVHYRWNRKAWMTSEIFIEWLRLLDKKFKRQNRKILLFIDNCGAHPHMDNLQAIKLAFLPPNTTSKLQPMDQGIIYNMKVKYRQELINYKLQCQEKGVEENVHVLKAIRLVFKAWEAVLPQCIKNCYRKAGFVTSITAASACDNDDDEDDNFTLADEIPLSRLASRMQQASYQVSAAEFAGIDADLIATETRSADDIVSAISTDISCGSSDDDTDEEDLPVPTYVESAAAVDLLHRALECEMDTPHAFFEELLSMKEFLEKCKSDKCKQKKLTDFFTA